MRIFSGDLKNLLLIILTGILLFCPAKAEEWGSENQGLLYEEEYWQEEDDNDAESSENLLYNGDFELTDPDGCPEGWYPGQYHTNSDNTEFSNPVDEETGRGRVAEIWNAAKNDARYEQTVHVEPETIYCLSGYIWAEDIKGGHGANFSIDNIYSFSEEVFDTGGEWVYIEYYGVTGPEQNQITVFIRVGGYGGESTGRARFDDLCLREVFDEAETGYVANWYTPDSDTDNDEYDYENGFDEYSGEPEYSEDGSNYYTVNEYYQDRQIDIIGTSRVFLILAAAGWLTLFLMFAAYFRGRKRTSRIQLQTERIYFVPVLLFAFAARMVISYWVEGYSVDVGCFNAWGWIMKEQGPLQFYPYMKENGIFCDYPPLYMYILALNSRIVGWTGASEAWSRVIFRFFPSVCDVLSCYLLYRFARKRMQENIHRVCAVLILFAINPAVILNSAAWGQIDSVLCLLLLMVALCAVEGKWQAALPIYAVSVLVKPQALMLGILGLIYVVITWTQNKESRKPIMIGVLISVVSMAAAVLPFGARQSFGWLIEKYKETLNSYQYATVNTANFYYLAGGNWKEIAKQCNVAAPLILAAGCIAYGCWWYFSNRKRKYVWIETILAWDFAFLFAVLAIMHVSWGIVGTVAMIYAFVITISFAVRKQDIRFIPYLGALLFILLYVFGVKMHERYIFPAIFLLAGAWVAQKDRRILYLLALFSATLFINEGIVLDNSIRFGPKYGHLLSATDVIVRYGTETRYFLPHTVAIADILSLLNIGGAVYAIYVACSMIFGGETEEKRYTEPVPFPDKLPRKKMPKDFRPDCTLHWSRIDALILAVVVLAYSVITLTTLGSTKAPQKGWTSSSSQEEIIFDLGEGEEDRKINILYFGRISVSDPSDFTFSQSTNLEQWSDEVYAKMDYGEYWKWQYVVSSYETDEGRTYNQSLGGILNFQCRYIRLKARRTGLRLNEIIFRDQNGNTVPATIIAQNYADKESALYSDPAFLLDEQDTLEALPDLVDGKNGDNKAAQPSWWNSTYFDEIYHARTGYEFLHPEEIRLAYNPDRNPYETTHPPLGKILISASVSVFGMTPFGWRFAGALAGILMLPGIYLLGKQLTKKTSIASLVTILMALDCMHLTQTQIATIDSYPVLFIIFAYFFMLRYIQTDIMRQPLRKSLVPLGCSGVFMGLSIASKWIGVYAGAGLAVLFFWHGFRMIRISREAKAATDCSSLSPGEKEAYLPYLQSKGNDPLPVLSRLFFICHWCILFFVVIPVGIYLISYIPYMCCRTDIHSVSDYLKAVWNCQINMFNYHKIPRLGMDHPFYSPWYEWPVMLKPMYYAARQYLTSRTKVPFSLYSFGNPVVWWIAIPAIGYCILRWMRTHCYQVAPGYDLPASRKKLFRQDIKFPCHLTASTYDNRISFVLIGFLAEYLPWVLVPRGTYIYHYFASVPFLILAVGLCFDLQPEDREKQCRVMELILVLFALAAFIVFFPYASGMAVSGSWLDIGKKVLRIGY